jgi:hypothetical protein
MDDRVTGREEAAAPATGPRLNIALWVLQVLLAATNVSIGDNPASPIVFLLFTVLLVWGRWPQFKVLVLRLRN